VQHAFVQILLVEGYIGNDELSFQLAGAGIIEIFDGNDSGLS